MKILDPGSVVRESELAMAMAAVGLEDKYVNAVKMLITGEKLTPTQRLDFKRLADTLNDQSKKQYDAKRLEYKAIADRNQLNINDVVGPESEMPDQPAATTPSVADIDAELARRRKAK